MMNVSIFIKALLLLRNIFATYTVLFDDWPLVIAAYNAGSGPGV